MKQEMGTKNCISRVFFKIFPFYFFCALQYRLLNSVFLKGTPMKKYLVFLIGLVLSSILRAEPLPAKEAFQLEVQHTTPNAFTLHWTIKPGYFLYSERIHITPDKDSNLDVGALRLPQTLTKTDKQGHTYPIYRNQLRIPVDVLGIKPGEALLRLTVQGCSDEGFCYPPERTDLIVSIDRHLALSSVNVEDPSSEGMKTLNQHPSDNLSHVFSDHNGWRRRNSSLNFNI
jgi:thiol:disulfide interchange protein DsbD